MRGGKFISVNNVSAQEQLRRKIYTYLAFLSLFFKMTTKASHTLKHQPHSRPQRPRSFWSAPRIATSSPVQRHSVFEWLCKHNRLRSQPIRFVRLDSEHAHSDGKSVNRGLPVLDLARGWARGRDSWCWPKGERPLGTRMTPTDGMASTLRIAHSHVTRAVVVIDCCFGLASSAWHSRLVQIRAKSSMHSALYCRGGCQAPL